jgi:TolB-like protein
VSDFLSELKRRNVFKVGVAYAIVAWALLQFVDIVAPMLALPDWFPKGILILLAVGFPIALLLSWAYEITPEGVKKTREVKRSKSITPKTGAGINKVIAGGLVLALAFIAYDKLGAPEQAVVGPAKAGQITLAVLPFADLSAGQDQEYFADGVSEEILNVLAGVKALKVTSRSSSFALKGQNLDVPAMGKKLGVDYLLEGSVRKQDERVRITAQLIEVGSDSHLWSNTYDRNASDIFAVQEEIAGAIAGALEIQFGAGTPPLEVKAPTASREAHEEYLKGRYFWNKRGIENLRTAITHYQQAIALDPEYALAYLGLAEGQVLIPDYDPVMTDQREIYLAAEASARKALELDPSLGQAHTTLAYILQELDRWGEAEAEFKKSVEMAPDYATGWQWYGNAKGMMGDIKASERMAAKARDLDPMSPIILSNYIDALVATGKTAEAQPELAAAMALFPDFALFNGTRGQLAYIRGDWPGAREAWGKLAQMQGIDPEIVTAWIDLAEAYQKTGKAQPVPPKLLASAKALDFYSSTPDMVYLAGQRELAFEELRGLLRLTGPRYLVFYGMWQPSYAPLRKDPRFKQVMRQAGFVDLWKKYGWPDQCHVTTGDDFECE